MRTINNLSQLNMGTLVAIRNLIPQEWDYVLRKNKSLSNFCKYVYRDSVPNYWKNAIHYRKAITSIKVILRNRPFLSCFNSNNTIEGWKYWAKINEEIQNYKLQYK